MKIFRTKDIKEIDAYTIQHEPVSSFDLMERAGSSCTRWILNHFTRDRAFAVFTGPGNNGGDGWVIARLMADWGYRNTHVYNLADGHEVSLDAATNRERLLQQQIVSITDLKTEKDFPALSNEQVVVDALFGSGLTRPLSGFAASLVRHINESGCTIISIDIPSGLSGEDNPGNTGSIIRACHTLTFQFPKRSFFFSENEKYTGQWHILDIGLHQDIIHTKETDFHFTTADDISIRKRNTFTHKGTFGHALLIAGSYGMAGAAILAAKACMRSGTGLLTTHLPSACYPIVQSVVPESIYSLDQSNHHFTHVPNFEKITAVGVGPGIGTASETTDAFELLLKNCTIPMVIDADAINILAANPELQKLIRPNSILTPHPGEFDRLAGSSSGGYERNERQIGYSKKYGVVIILKGAYTSVTLGSGKCLYNSTGNPGMATAGSGDVLTGIVLSLLAQGSTPEHAAVAGTFLHGMAGDLAAMKYGQYSLIASDIIENLGNAFKKLDKNEKRI